jgi:glycosyltransferase involved in cell wall biosynthesis
VGVTHPAQIVFVNRFFHPDHSATSQILSDLAFDLVRNGQGVAVVTSRLLYDDPSQRLAGRERIEGVEVRRVVTTGFGRGALLGRAVDFASFYVSAFVELLRLLRRGDVVVAKTDPPLLSIVVGVAAALKGARLVNWLQDVYPEVASALGERLFGGPVGAVLTGLRNASLRGAHINVVLGERMASHLRAANIAAERIAIVPNWSDETTLIPVPHAENPLRAEWGLKGRYVVGYSGNLGRAHEYGTMLGAARELRDEQDIVFLVIGGGHYARALKAEAEADGLGNVIFKPYQPFSALSASLSVADIHWLSLRPEVEGLIVPSKVYGILAAGRPVLAVTDPDGEVARLVRSHGCGLHVAPGDAAAFAQAIRTLARDAPGAAALGRAARAAAEQVYAREKALSKWRDVLRHARLPEGSAARGVA